MNYSTISVETVDRVGVIRFNRPDAMNAVNADVRRETALAIDAFEADDAIGCLLITGSETVFAAGADIKEMSQMNVVQAYKDDFMTSWYRLIETRKPVVAAVAGYALGGGCEIAMLCDIIIAAENAKFGLPEIKLGVIPAAGGTQRLIRQIGKSKALEMLLTGRLMGADEAERANLVSRVVPVDQLIEEAMKTATKIASMSLPIAMMAKEAALRAYETTLSEGTRFERRLFYSQFAFTDQSEGMNAFIQKREATFTHR